MPIVEFTAFQERFDDRERCDALIKALTEAVVSVLGQDVGRETEVLLRGVPREQWGFGGETRQ